MRRCWPWAHDWTGWRTSQTRWSAVISIFALPGSALHDTTLVKTTRTRACKKCGKVQQREIERHFEGETRR